ncbi:MAG: undecaprenyl-diphosphate phosphatase [Actinobacteria bacterium]|jgi:undecaprenyl-diphosphatase|nr:undecaprenyl-diphosphate phosphatase [Actinomycetota bacterium]MBU1493520.1 undecaprenyl-diphosphate phosphatase [Actinomycetota bacterium]
MLTAALWGLIQGLTEFLPISSSGHLVLVPALLGMDEPDLATTAVLHLGTLAAVVWFYRRDLMNLVHFRTDPGARRILWLLVLGTLPAAIIGVLFHTKIEILFSDPWIVAVLLIGTGVILSAGLLVPRGTRRVEEGRTGDALVVGWAQALALLPGISRSGMTMTAAMAQGFERVEAARFAFLMAVPAIAGAGTLEGIDLVRSGGFEPALLAGVLTAAVSGYLAISFLVRLLGRAGLAPFAIYCLVVGSLAWWLV